MRTRESVVSFFFASVCVSGCAVDVVGTGSEAPSATDQTMSQTTPTSPKKQKGDYFRVDLSANSADGSCVPNGDSFGRCNLRGALAAAAHAESPVTIDLAVDSTIDAEPIVLAAPATDAGYEVIIRTPDTEPAKAITGFAASRFIEVPAGVLLDLHNVHISGFAAVGEGGAILNRGAVHLHQVTLFDNRVTCEAVGGLQAVVLCGGGAVANYGSLLVTDGTRIESNRVLATAMVAAFPTATAVGGAVVSYGNFVIDGDAVLAGNFVMADAWPGVHPVTGTVTANALGGAVYNAGGTMLVIGADQRCSFYSNRAIAQASGLHGEDTVMSSLGGAIASVGGMLEIGSSACGFSANSADQDADVYNAP
jgi:hypothetical protein